MVNSNSFGKLQVQLCELKLEERRVKSDITKLVKNKQMIDFYQAQQLNSQKASLKNKNSKTGNTDKPEYYRLTPLDGLSSVQLCLNPNRKNRPMK